MFLIAGADSEVGRAVIDAFRSDGTPVMGTTRRPGMVGSGRLLLDLGDMPADWSPPEGLSGVCIAAAVARLADCEADPIGSARVNCAGTIALAERLVQRGIYTLFLSTNQVFDGMAPGVPADTELSPTSEYGRQKARTEMALRRMMSDGAPVGILRLSKVVAPDMKLFADWRMSLKAGRPVRAFEDMTLAPVPIALVTRAIVVMMRERIARVVQLTGPRDITYREAARFVAGVVGADARLVEPGRAADIGLPPGATPKHTTLDSGYLRDSRGIDVPDAYEVVGEVMRGMA
jgi:dTDP-4-dehydrorhamnose reductase